MYTLHTYVYFVICRSRSLRSNPCPDCTSDSKSQSQFLIGRVSAEIKLCEPRQALQRLVALIHLPIDLPRGKALHMFLLFAECTLHISPALSTLNIRDHFQRFSAENLLLSVAMRARIAPIHHRPHIRQPPAQRKRLRRTMSSSHGRQKTFYLRAVAASLRDFARQWTFSSLLPFFRLLQLCGCVRRRANSCGVDEYGRAGESNLQTHRAARS